MEFSFLIAFLVSLNSLQSFAYIIVPIFLFILSFFDIRLFEISNKDKINYFKNKVKNNFSTRIDDNNKHSIFLILYIPCVSMSWLPDNEGSNLVRCTDVSDLLPHIGGAAD